MNNNNLTNSTTSTEEQPQGFNRTGVLNLKNVTDTIEYCLYDNKRPYPICAESININDTLRIYTYDTINLPIHISLLDIEGLIFSGTGRLTKDIVNGVEKFYLDTIDLEDILFNNTEKVITIKINVIRDVVRDKGENKENEPKKNEFTKKS